MEKNKSAEKVFNNNDLKNIIESYLKCIWCQKVPERHHKLEDWDLLTVEKCIYCLLTNILFICNIILIFHNNQVDLSKHSGIFFLLHKQNHVPLDMHSHK